MLIGVEVARKSPWAMAGEAFDGHCETGGCLGDEPLDVFVTEDRMGGALGARRRLWELRLLPSD
jgi:hypothetical protein